MAELTESTDKGGRRRINSRSTVGFVTLMAGLVSVTAFAVSGCTAQVVEPGVPSSTELVEEQITVADTEPTGDAVWLEKGTRIALLTYGSTSCPPEFEVDADEDSFDANNGRIKVSEVLPETSQACTKDFGPRISLIDTPTNYDTGQVTRLVVSGEGLDAVYDLPWIPVSGQYSEDRPEPATSASFILGGEYIVAIVNGDSGCGPTVTGSELTADQQITATFDSYLAADCPAATGEAPVLIPVPGEVDTEEFAELVLVGDGLEGAVDVPAVRIQHFAPRGQTAMEYADTEAEAFWVNRRTVGIIIPATACLPEVEYDTERTGRGALGINAVPNSGIDCDGPVAPYLVLRSANGLVPDSAKNTVTLNWPDSSEELTLPPYVAVEPAESEYDPLAGWAQDGTVSVLWTRGSGSCPPSFDSVEMVSATEMTAMQTPLPPDAFCTSDMNGRISLVTVPDGVSRTEPVTVTINNNGNESLATLPPLE